MNRLQSIYRGDAANYCYYEIDSINSGLPAFFGFGSNHTGYPEIEIDEKFGKENGLKFRKEIGVVGQPGHGYIHIGADDHIVTSLWNGTPLYGDTQIISINPADMLILAGRLEKKVKNRLRLAGKYMGNAAAIVKHEASKYHQRIAKLQSILHAMLDDLAENPVFKGIASTANGIGGVVDFLIVELGNVKEKCKDLNRIINNRPMGFPSLVNIGIDATFSEMERQLEKLGENVEDLVSAFKSLIKSEVPELLRSVKRNTVDAVVDEFTGHYNTIKNNNGIVLGLVDDYETQISGIAESFRMRDSMIAYGGGTNSILIEGPITPRWTGNFCIKPSTYLDDKMDVLRLHVDNVFGAFKVVVTAILWPILDALDIVLDLIRIALEALIITVNTIANSIKWSPTGFALSWFTDFSENIDSGAASVKKPILWMLELVENLQTGVQRIRDNIPGVLENFKEYIKTAAFAPDDYENVRLYNIASAAILDEIDTMFRDVVTQLSRQKAKSIDAAIECSKSVLMNIEELKTQVDKGIL